jgi:hypothetical protein
LRNALTRAAGAEDIGTGGWEILALTCGAVASLVTFDASEDSTSIDVAEKEEQQNLFTNGGG